MYGYGNAWKGTTWSYHAAHVYSQHFLGIKELISMYSIIQFSVKLKKNLTSTNNINCFMQIL